MKNTGKPVVSSAVGPGHDPWLGLRRYTSARIALGRTGGSQRMDTVLDFRLSYARARDAVMAAFDLEGIAGRFAAAGFATHRIATAVADKKTYLVRPDLGRRIDDSARNSALWHRRGENVISRSSSPTDSPRRQRSATQSKRFRCWPGISPLPVGRFTRFCSRRSGA